MMKLHEKKKKKKKHEHCAGRVKAFFLEFSVASQSQKVSNAAERRAM